MNVIELKNIPEGAYREFESILIYKKGSTRVARNGSEFLMVELTDKTGSFSVTCFNDTAEFNFFKNTPEGSIVKIAGTSDHYQSRFSPKIMQLLLLKEEDLSENGALENLVESSTENPNALWAELLTFTEKVENGPLRAAVKQVLTEMEALFKVCPAAMSMHHAYRHGLLEHTVHVVRAGYALLPLYPEVNKDLAISGMILHDVGKLLEYEGNLVIKRSRIGRLQGHVVLGYRIVRRATIQNQVEAQLCERLEHIILSHQGELEWGAAVVAATPEAVFVSLIDNLDAKMGMVQYALRKTVETDTFSEFQPGLKSAILVEKM